MKNKHAILLVMLLAGLAAAQTGTSEVKQQTLHFGEYISQLCLQHNITSVGDYYVARSDCIGFLTVRDTSGRLILSNKAMSLLGEGMYGYMAKASELKTDTLYRAVVNFSLPSGQSGEVSSSFTVSSDAQAESVTQDGGILSGLSDYLKLDLTGFAGAIADGILTVFDKLGIMPFLKAFYQVGMDGLKVVEAFGNTINFVVTIIGGLFLDPLGTFDKVILPFITNLFISAAILYFLWVALFEVAAIGYAFIRNPEHDVFKMFGEWFMFHIKVLVFVFKAIEYMVMLVISLISVVLRAVSTVRQIFQI